MSENFEKCVICHEDVETGKLNKCTSCSAHYCTCCLVSLMMNSFKKDDQVLNCCYCSKKMQIKFNNGIELPIDIRTVNTIVLPHFGQVEYHGNIDNDYCYLDEDARRLNTAIFMNNDQNFHFNDDNIRHHLICRNQLFTCHINIKINGTFELEMFPVNQIYFHHIDKNSETQTDFYVHNQLCFDYNQEHNRWDFKRESTDISKRRICLECKGAVSRNYQFHVANSKVHKKYLEDKEKVNNQIQALEIPIST